MNNKYIEPIIVNTLTGGKWRNCICPCNSGKKVKKCCGLDRYITQHKYNEIKFNMAKNKMMKEKAINDQLRAIIESEKKESKAIL